MAAARIEFREHGNVAANAPAGRLEVRIDSPTSWTLFGELDVATGWTLRATADTTAPTGRLELWLHRLTFMDIAGWRAMHDVHHRLDGDLVLVSPSPQVEQLLLLAGLP